MISLCIHCVYSLAVKIKLTSATKACVSCVEINFVIRQRYIKYPTTECFRIVY